MTKRVGVRQVISLLSRAVKEKGEDYVDPGSNSDSVIAGCKYFKRSGNPSCIVGHVFSYLDVQPFPRSTANGEGLDVLIEKRQDIEQMFTPRALDLLLVAQQAQDQGCSWGSALKAVREGRG